MTFLETTREIFRFRDLVTALVVRELKMRYRGSVLGFVWSFLNPLLLMAVYALVFSFFTRHQIENYTLFVLTGLPSLALVLDRPLAQRGVDRERRPSSRRSSFPWRSSRS